MPFKSDAQRRYMYSQHPEIAKRWQKHTPKGKDLPEHVKKSAHDAISSALGSADTALQDLGHWSAGKLEGVGLPQLKEYLSGGASKAKPFVAQGPGALNALMQHEAPLPGKARLAGLGTVGAGALGAYGLYRVLKSLLGSKQEQQPKMAEAKIGTPFTDGFLSFCIDHKLNGEQVADMLEKGAALTDRTGAECRGLLERAGQL